MYHHSYSGELNSPLPAFPFVSTLSPSLYENSLPLLFQLGFLLVTLIWKFDFSPFMTLIIAILNDGTVLGQLFPHPIFTLNPHLPLSFYSQVLF